MDSPPSIPLQLIRVRFPANAAGRPFAELHRPPGRGVRGGERELGAGSQPAGPAAFAPIMELLWIIFLYRIKMKHLLG